MHRLVWDEKPLWLMLLETTEQMHVGASKYVSREGVESMLDLTYTQQRVMRQVCMLTEDESEGVSLKALADAVGLSSGTTSAIVENLVQRGLLERHPSPSDRRSVRISLSRGGCEKFREGHAYFRDVIQPFFDRIKAGDQAVMREILTQLKQFFEQNNQEK